MVGAIQGALTGAGSYGLDLARNTTQYSTANLLGRMATGALVGAPVNYISRAVAPYNQYMSWAWKGKGFLLNNAFSHFTR